MKTNTAYVLAAVAANIAMMAAPYESLTSKVGFWLFIAITAHQAYRAFIDVVEAMNIPFVPFGMERNVAPVHSKPGWYVVQFMILFVLAVYAPGVAVAAWTWFFIASIRLSLHIRSLEVTF